MRRRAADYRRPVRRRLSYWICLLLAFSFILATVLFVIQHNHHQDPLQYSLLERNARVEHFAKESLNFTEEILSVTSFSRQLAQQMILAKAYVVIAKEHNNLHLAWQLSSKIRSCQLLLSKAAMTGEPVTLEEAEPIIKSLTALIFKAQDIHYDIATTIVTMKSHIQALEERANDINSPFNSSFSHLHHLQSVTVTTHSANRHNQQFHLQSFIQLKSPTFSSYPTFTQAPSVRNRNPACHRSHLHHRSSSLNQTPSVKLITSFNNFSNSHSSAAAKRFDYIEKLLEHQETLPQSRSEGFVIRIITLYGKAGMVRHALDTFYEMHCFKCRTTVKSFNAALNVLVSNRRFHEVVKFLDEVPSRFNIKLDVYSVNIAVKAFCEGDKFQEAYLFMIDCENNKVGKPDAVLVELAKEVGADAVYAHREVSHEEEKIEGVMEKESISHITNIIINLPSTVAAYVRERYSTNPTATSTPLL